MRRKFCKNEEYIKDYMHNYKEYMQHNKHHMRRSFMHGPHWRKRHLTAGIIFMTIGVLLLLNNLNILPASVPSYLFTWKSALIIVGTICLFKKKWVPGLMFISIALYLLLPEILGVPRPDIYQFWPAVFIMLGLGILLKAIFPEKKHQPVIIDKQTEDFMENTVIFGGNSKKVSSYEFKGGKFTAIFGGLELDFTDCALAKEGGSIEVVAVCGGIHMKVPKEWNIISEAFPVIGGIHDNIHEMPDVYTDPAAKLILKGVAVMGGVDIQRV